MRAGFTQACKSVCRKTCIFVTKVGIYTFSLVPPIGICAVKVVMMIFI